MELSPPDRLKKFGFVDAKGKPDVDPSKVDMLDAAIATHPKPLNRHKLIFSKFGASVEEPYFWILDHARELRNFNDVIKIRDIFSAAEHSAMFGAGAQRLGIQQDRATQYIAQIGKFMKELFQQVREIRIIKMRLKMYDDSAKGDKTADMALKGIWVDMVEGGGKNPSSVIGLANLQGGGFTILPDLFFGTYIKKTEDVQNVIKNLRFNEKVKEVLARKMYSYMTWRDATWEEMKQRDVFMIKYLRQQYLIIKTYMNWVRPHLLHVKRLQMSEKHLKSPEIVGAFETAVIELEQMFRRKTGGTKHFYEVILVTYNFRTRPGMEYNQDGYQHRGPIHWGRVEIDFRSYVWSQNQVDNYIAYRDDEDLELLGSLDGSIEAAMQSLGSSLKAYLNEAGEKFAEDIEDEKLAKEAEKRKQKGFSAKDVMKTAVSPITNVLNGFAEMTVGREIFTDGAGDEAKKSVTGHEQWLRENDRKAAKSKVNLDMWLLFNIFKKGHRMLNW